MPAIPMLSTARANANALAYAQTEAALYRTARPALVKVPRSLPYGERLWLIVEKIEALNDLRSRPLWAHEEAAEALERGDDEMADSLLEEEEVERLYRSNSRLTQLHDALMEAYMPVLRRAA